MIRNDAEILTQKVVAILERERVGRRITKLQISKETGLSRTAYTLIVDNKNSPTLRTLFMIAGALQTDLKEVIAKAEKETKTLK